jgi:hypothetical protein
LFLSKIPELPPPVEGPKKSIRKWRKKERVTLPQKACSPTTISNYAILWKKSLNSVGNNINNHLSPQLIEHNNKTWHIFRTSENGNVVYMYICSCNKVRTQCLVHIFKGKYRTNQITFEL